MDAIFILGLPLFYAGLVLVEGISNWIFYKAIDDWREKRERRREEVQRKIEKWALKEQARREKERAEILGL